MKKTELTQRLAVCSWSLHPAGPEQLVQQMKAIGLSHVQLDLDPFTTQPAVWDKAAEIFARNGITPVSGMFNRADLAVRDSATAVPRKAPPPASIPRLPVSVQFTKALSHEPPPNHAEFPQTAQLLSAPPHAPPPELAARHPHTSLRLSTHL